LHIPRLFYLWRRMMKEWGKESDAGLRVREIIAAIEAVAPRGLQESFDNSGVQAGDTDIPARGAMLCLDITEGVMDEALHRGCNLIIAHHPLLFKACKSLTGQTYIERCLIKACKEDLVLYAAHTNMDNAWGGINSWLAERLGLQGIRVLRPQQHALLKVAVHAPEATADAIREAMCSAGAGRMGRYDSCTYQVAGEGRFRPLEGSHPFCGAVGELHKEKEVRIEAIVPAHCRDRVLSAVRAAHPYEAPAVDVYALENEWEYAGCGAIGEMPEQEDEGKFLLRLKAMLRAGSVRHSALRGKKVKRVALCGGSGSFLIPDAMAEGADVFVTGEARYNDFYDVEDRMLLAVAGHYETEICATEIFYRILSEKFPTFALHISNNHTNPVKYI